MPGTIVVESLYYREQFDDWLAGGELRVAASVCRWSASSSNYGLGWEVEPVGDEPGRCDLTEEDAEQAIAAVERVLREHRYEYAF